MVSFFTDRYDVYDVIDPNLPLLSQLIKKSLTDAGFNAVAHG
jgi:hypothetical protein